MDVVRGLNLDPLHVNLYNTDEEGSEAGDTVGSKSRVPGERIAAAVDNMDTFQQQVHRMGKKVGEGVAT